MFHFSPGIIGNKPRTFFPGWDVCFLVGENDRTIYFSENRSPDGASVDVFVFGGGYIICGAAVALIPGAESTVFNR